MNFKENTKIDKRNRDSVLESLKQSNWPISKSDFLDLENLIEEATDSLRLSKNLTKYLLDINEKKTAVKSNYNSDFEEDKSEAKVSFIKLKFNKSENFFKFSFIKKVNESNRRNK